MIFQNNIDYFKERHVYFKGGDSGDTYDAAYNARMASIAEDQSDMAMEYFDFWKSDYKALEEAQIASNIAEIPSQSALNLENIQAARDALPGQVALGKAQNEYGIDEINAKSAVLPGQTDLTLEQIASQRELLPGQTELAGEQISDTLTGLKEKAPVRSAFYKSALDGINIDERVNNAAADATQSFGTANAVNRRNTARMGINPNSGRFAEESRTSSLDMAKTVASAKTGARTLAELEQFGRLQTAMGA